MTPLQEETQSYYTKRFYFELKLKTAVEHEDHSAARLTGNILCRFPPGSKEIQALGEAFCKRSTDAYNQQYADGDPYFVISKRWKSDETLNVVIGTRVVERMMRESHFHIDQVTFIVSKRIFSRDEHFPVLWRLTPPEPILHPISGFPKCLLEEERKVLSKTRHSSGLSCTRTPTRAHHRGTWTLPDHPNKFFDPISRYQHPDYVYPGDADWRAISQIKQRFAPVSGASSYESSVSNQTLQTTEPEASNRTRDAPGSATHCPEREDLTSRTLRAQQADGPYELAGSEVHELPTPFPYQTWAPPYDQFGGRE